MKLSHLFLIGCIFAGVTIAWYMLGSTISSRTLHLSEHTKSSVSGRWGPPLRQMHPVAQAGANGGGAQTLPSRSAVAVKLSYQPVKMGLFWHRTYTARFSGDYIFTNASAITQPLQIRVRLPESGAVLDNINFTVGAGDKARKSLNEPADGVMTETVELAPNESVPVTLSYDCRGMNDWSYEFPESSRIRDFALTITTDFDEANFPQSSPSSRKAVGDGLELAWKYEDAISAPGMTVEMPEELNAGPLASAISFYAPLSLLLFFGVLMIATIARGVSLHPVNFLFLAAGYFAFPLLFAYTVDVMPVHLSFLLAAAVSVALVSGYLRAAAGVFMFRVGLAAQIIYMVLFSYSFFFEGLTGLTLTLGGIITLTALMHLTAKVDWSEKLAPVSPRLA
jgi:hypothetical protein